MAQSPQPESTLLFLSPYRPQPRETIVALSSTSSRVWNVCRLSIAAEYFLFVFGVRVWRGGRRYIGSSFLFNWLEGMKMEEEKGEGGCRIRDQRLTATTTIPQPKAQRGKKKEVKRLMTTWQVGSLEKKKRVKKKKALYGLGTRLIFCFFFLWKPWGLGLTEG